MINGQSYSGLLRQKLVAAVLLFALFGPNWSAALGQTHLPDSDGIHPSVLNSDALTTLVWQQAHLKCAESVAQNICAGPRQTTLIQQQAALKMESVGQNIEYQLWPESGIRPEIFKHPYYPNAFVSDDILSNFVEYHLQSAQMEMAKIQSEAISFFRSVIAGKP